MSEKARELADKLKPSYFEDTVAKRLATQEIDAAVAPLVGAVRDLLAWVEPLAGDNSDDEESAREIATVKRVSKALEGWKQ